MASYGSGLYGAGPYGSVVGVLTGAVREHPRPVAVIEHDSPPSITERS